MFTGQRFEFNLLPNSCALFIVRPSRLASCDTWRSFVHPIPLPVPHETQLKILYMKPTEYYKSKSRILSSYFNLIASVYWTYVLRRLVPYLSLSNCVCNVNVIIMKAENDWMKSIYLYKHNNCTHLKCSKTTEKKSILLTPNCLIDFFQWYISLTMCTYIVYHWQCVLTLAYHWQCVPTLACEL